MQDNLVNFDTGMSDCLSGFNPLILFECRMQDNMCPSKIHNLPVALTPTFCLSNAIKCAIQASLDMITSIRELAFDCNLCPKRLHTPHHSTPTPSSAKNPCLDYRVHFTLDGGISVVGMDERRGRFTNPLENFYCISNNKNAHMLS